MPSGRAGAMMRLALKGLTQEQRLKVMAHLPPPNHFSAAQGSPREGWTVYRAPTTINPPTTLRLHYRDRSGKLIQIISITEKGITK